MKWESQGTFLTVVKVRSYQNTGLFSITDLVSQLYHIIPFINFSSSILDVVGLQDSPQNFSALMFRDVPHLFPAIFLSMCSANVERA